MNILSVILATMSALLLSACVTAEFEQMQSQCQGEGLRQFPVVQQPQVFRRSRQVDVPDGSTVCESQSIESKEKRTDMTSSRSVCRPGTRRATEYYDETVMVDLNSGAREAYANQCARDQCMKRYGNVKCKLGKRR
jgi:hypothetical protein